MLDGPVRHPQPAARAARDVARQATFIESHLRLGNPITSYQRADLNGDGRDDLILAERDGAERVLNIFYQAADGHFPSEPRRASRPRRT
jgi:hypothetical protein